ncbi:MAG: hypothetical protein GY715_00955 [Planctomycetes bacterium]|nr:hypothetical protein [Planctomycetota bacterium]
MYQRLALAAAGLAGAVIVIGQLGSPVAAVGDASPADGLSDCTSVGPDVIVGDFADLVANYQSEGGIEAYAIGTTSCNIGDAELQWVASTSAHPVIAQNMFRLKNDRFEHIGQSWLKHAYYALQQALCCAGCYDSGTGLRLGVGCSDPYSASRNGAQNGAGPKYEVDAHTGIFPYPPASPAYSGNVARRLQVAISDLDPAQAGGGQYFVEAQYVTPDDAAAGNQNNNASHRAATITGGGTTWTLGLTGSTERERPAIRAWRDSNPDVVETDVQIPGDGLIIIAALATDLGDGWWQYEYAVHNLNSDRSVGSFAVPADAAIADIGFHDVDYHSGEPQDGTDWPAVADGASVSWATTDYATNADANAIRWGTLYNFRFRSTAPPAETTVTLGLFKPGTPVEVLASTTGPSVAPPACPEDLDTSGDVGFGDILVIIGAWGPCGASCPEDLSDNGNVDFADILAVIGAWGPCQ